LIQAGNTLDAGSEYAGEDGWLVDEEANYGGCDSREELARAGVAFYGNHFEGGDYGACRFAAMNGEMREFDGDHDLWLVVRLDEDAEHVNEEALKEALEYLRFEKQVKALVDAEWPEPEKPSLGLPG
jgi:hypothetical protein